MKVQHDVTLSRWESADWDELRPARQVFFERQWRHLWRDSAFYRKKLSEAGVTERDLPDLRELSALPFTTKEEFRRSLEAHPPLGEQLAVEVSDLRQIQTSSGTTGRPLAMGMTPADAAASNDILGRGYRAIGFTPHDVILHMFSMSRGWIGGLCMVDAYLAMGATALPIGAEAGRDSLLEIIQMFRPTGYCATPGFLISLGQRALELGLEPAALGVRHMLTGGEAGGGIPAVRRQIIDLWGDATLQEVMGGTDVYPIVWAECPALGGMHFVATEYVWFELVDPDTGVPLPVELGAVGEIVYTHLRREASPILRFRHNDIVEVTGTGPCECGRTAPQIRCVGRADDMLIVKGVNLFPSAIRDLLSRLPGVGPEFRIRKPAGTNTLPGPVSLRVERNGESAPAENELARTLHQKLSVAFSVEYVSPGSLSVGTQHKARYFEELL